MIRFAILLLMQAGLPAPHYLAPHNQSVRVVLNGLPHEATWMMGVATATGPASQVTVQQGTAGAKAWTAVRVTEGTVDVGELSHLQGKMLVISLQVPADTRLSVEGDGRELYKGTFHEHLLVINGRVMPVH